MELKYFQRGKYVFFFPIGVSKHTVIIFKVKFKYSLRIILVLILRQVFSTFYKMCIANLF